MKVTKAAAAIFLVAIGMSRADTWGVEKLTEALKHTARNKEESEIPEDRRKSFKKLVEAGDDIEVFDNGKAPDPERMKDAKKKRVARLVSNQKSHTKNVKSKRKKKQKPKHKAIKKDKKPRDSFGCILGSISARVNAVVNGNWMDEEEIAKKAGMSLKKARGRLYFAADDGVYERRRLIQYRVIPGAAEKRAQKNSKHRVHKVHKPQGAKTVVAEKEAA